MVFFEEVVTESREAQGWRALLTLFAIGDRLDDFLRVVGPALESGLSSYDVLQVLQLLPADKHVDAVQRVMAAHGEAEWDTGTVADIYIGAGATGLAVEILVEALATNVDASLAVRLVNAAPDQAAAVLTAMLGGPLADAQFASSIAQAFVSAGRPDLALPFLNAALAANPMDFSVLSSLNQVDSDLALRHARSLVLDSPDNAAAWGWLGNLELQNGNMAAAFEAYKEAASRNVSTEYLNGMMQADPERAMRVALEVTEGTSDDEVLGSLAKIALKNGHSEEAFAALLRAHERDPTDHEWLLAMVNMDPERSAAVLAESSRTYTGGGQDEVIGAYGNALRALGQTSAAFEEYMRAHEMDPTDWEWQQGLAAADPARAVPVLEARLAEQAGDASLLGALADAYAGSGRVAEAIEYYQRAYANGQDVTWLAHMARVDPDRAVSQLVDLSVSQPSNSEVFGRLGDAYREIGRLDDARDAYARARELAPSTLTWEIRWRELTD
jgi:tetratricopeptide (TPR) repeat protein